MKTQHRIAYALTALGLLSTLTLSTLAKGNPPEATDAQSIRAVFEPFAPKVKTRTDDRSFYVESNGMPDHPLMVGITAWQQQVPIPQKYTGANAWQFPLKPVPAAEPLSAKDHFFRGAIAIAADGVPIFNALNNRGEDSYKIGELDEFGGHAGRADDYHYHAAPIYLEKIVGKGKPIAYALDGYPIYSLTEPDGKPATGLDAFNGHTTSTHGYHYHATRTYPYINGGFHGTVIERNGQVDPQPFAQPVRPATTPLRGAKVTAFSRPTTNSYSVNYVRDGKAHKVNYRQEADGSYTFDYVSPDGGTVTEKYAAQREGSRRPARNRVGESGPSRLRGENRPRDLEGRPPRPDANARGANRPSLAPETEIVQPKPGDFQLTSTSVVNGGAMPRDFTCDGNSDSLPLSWKNAPVGTKSFALIMHHNPPGNESPHVYWILYDIPGNVSTLPRNSPSTGKPGLNTINRKTAFAPPCSKGPGKKWYTLTLYALSKEAILPGSAAPDRDTLLKAIKDDTLGTATLTVSYTREER